MYYFPLIKKSILIVGLILTGWLGVVTIAFPNDLEIAFATVSGETDYSTKTAGCIIVWLTGANTQNIYCRYELEKDNEFQRDNDAGINLAYNYVKLYSSKNKAAFQYSIKNWFRNNDLYPTPTPTDLSYFADAMSRLFDPKIHHFVLDDQLDIGTNEQFAVAVHYRLIKAQIPEKVIEEAKTVATEVQEKAEAAIVENDATTSQKFAGLEQRIIHISIYLFCLLFLLLFIWFFLASRKTTRQLKESEAILETKIDDHVSIFYQEIANMKIQIKILQDKTLPKNESSSQNSSSYYRTEIGLLEGKNRQLENKMRSECENAENVLNAQLEIEREKSQGVIERLEGEKRDLEEKLQNLEKQLRSEKTRVEKNREKVQTISHAEQTLQSVLFKRFRLIKPKETDFAHWTTALIDQKGIWNWLQPALLGELLICEPIFSHIKKGGAKKDQDILNLLNLNSIMAYWGKLVSQQFENNDKLWEYLRDKDGSQWLNQFLRADDVLNTYFPEEKHFKLLSLHLSNVNGILRAALLEMGITKILAPKLLEKVPNYVPAKKDKNQIYTPNPLLKELVKEKVQNRLKEMPQFVVDVQRYGFCTADNPDAAADAAANVQVFVSHPSEWE
jgi:hypothetical protein